MTQAINAPASAIQIIDVVYPSFEYTHMNVSYVIHAALFRNNASVCISSSSSNSTAVRASSALHARIRKRFVSCRATSSVSSNTVSNRYISFYIDSILDCPARRNTRLPVFGIGGICGVYGDHSALFTMYITGQILSMFGIRRYVMTQRTEVHVLCVF